MKQQSNYKIFTVSSFNVDSSLALLNDANNRNISGGFTSLPLHFDVSCQTGMFSAYRQHHESTVTLDIVSLDFFLGEQPHSLQLLQLRDSLFNPLLNDLRHFVDTAVTGSALSVIY